MLKATESKFMLLLLIIGGIVGIWFAWDEAIFSSAWANKFFSATAAVSTISAIVFRIVSAEHRFHSNQKTDRIENLTKEISEIIPKKFEESARHLEMRFMKIEHEANVRYNRQMMSQEDEYSEFWHYQQDFGREKTLNICVEQKTESSAEAIQDDYTVQILGTYENTGSIFTQTFYIVRVISAEARGTHTPTFREGEKLACFYANTPIISRICDRFSNPSYKFHISGRMGEIDYGSNVLAEEVSIKLRLVDEIERRD